ncbi:MAG: hypothetical protein AB1414_05135 [bacterium]
MGGKEIGVKRDVFFTFYSLLSTSYFQEKPACPCGTQRTMKIYGVR